MILIVDDSPIMADALRTALNGRGYRVAVAADGASALALLEPLRPDLVLLDVCMPKLDGVAFLERLDAHGDARPKVIAYSGAAGLEGVARRGGADAFLAKPLQLDELVRTIESLLGSSSERLDRPEVRAQLQLVVDWLRDFFGAQRAFATQLVPGALRLLACSVPEPIELPPSVDPAAHFCPEVVRTATPLVLHDAASHPTFASHLATGAGVRFYAGAPLFDAHDSALGSLCVEDEQPRPFFAEDMTLLGHVAQLSGLHLAGRGAGAMAAPLTLHQPSLGVLLELELKRQQRHGGGIALALLSSVPTFEREAVPDRRRMAVVTLDVGVAVILSDESREVAERRMLYAMDALNGGGPPERAVVVTAGPVAAREMGPHDLLGIASDALAGVASGIVSVHLGGDRTLH